MASATKSGPRLVAFDDLEFVPRFEYGEMAQLAGVCGGDDGTEMAAGLGRMTKARIPWTIHYDEVLTVLEGELRVHIGEEVLVAGPKDSIWLPAGTALIYEAEDVLISYAIHPVDWQARLAAGGGEGA